MTSHLTESDRASLRGLGQGQVPAAVDVILTNHWEQWEWEYGERVRRLQSQLEESERQLAGARLALAAIRDVQRGSEAGR